MERTESKKDIEELIEICRSIAQSGGDPFLFDIGKALNSLRNMRLRSSAELDLDAETIGAIVDVLNSQKGWIEKRMNSMLIDPLIVELRIRAMDTEELRDVAMSVYHPLAFIETITPKRLQEGINYIKNLIPIRERGRYGEEKDYPIEPLSDEELLEMSVITKEELEKKIEEMKRELKKETDYYAFVMNDSYEESVKRAQILSFLISGGFATLIIDPLNDDIRVKLSKKRGRGRSVALSINYEMWEKRNG